VAEYQVKTGQTRKIVHELTYILFDDPVSGPIAAQKVDLVYADGLKSQLTTNDNGEIRVSVDHGDYVDATISLEDEIIQRRVYVCLRVSSVESKVWRLLVNLGYVHEKQPSASPSSEEVLIAAIEEFQFDQNVPITGTPDHTTLQRIQVFLDDETIWCEHKWIPDSELKCPGAKDQRESAT